MHKQEVKYSKSYKERLLYCPKCKEYVKPQLWTIPDPSPFGVHWEESCPICGYILSED